MKLEKGKYYVIQIQMNDYLLRVLDIRKIRRTCFSELPMIVYRTKVFGRKSFKNRYSPPSILSINENSILNHQEIRKEKLVLFLDNNWILGTNFDLELRS